MKLTNISYISLIILHIILGFLVHTIPIVSILYGLLTLLLGVIYILRTKNRNNEVLVMASYIVGLEVFFRMTGGGISHEIGKYAVIIYMSLGILYSGIKRNSFIYLLFVLLLIPAILVSAETLGHNTDFRKAIIFNLLGSICLGISSLYCYQREIYFNQLKNIFIAIGLPIVCTLTYLFLYTPNLQEVIRNTGSNFKTSGGFGPNQVSTILGLGMFVFFTLILFNPRRNKILLVVNVLLFMFCAYRGILTFSRGGVYVGVVMIIILLFNTFRKVNLAGRSKIILLSITGVILSIIVWTYTSLQTDGLIDKRYANQDAAGREKESILTGRETLMKTELEMFLDHPLLGIGVGKNREERFEMTGIEAASHNEVTRLLAEHGMLGVFALLILIYVPLSLYPTNRENLFLLCFFFFWALTINHAAMRLAAPAFIYALSLLKVRFDENPSLHREQTL